MFSYSWICGALCVFLSGDGVTAYKLYFIDSNQFFPTIKIGKVKLRRTAVMGGIPLSAAEPEVCGRRGVRVGRCPGGSTQRCPPVARRRRATVLRRLGAAGRPS